MYAFDRDGVLVGVLGNYDAGHPKNYKGAEMPLIKSVLSKVPKNSIIISNQAGIDRGYTTLKVVQSQFDWLMAQQPNFIAAFFCPDEGESCWYKVREKINAIGYARNEWRKVDRQRSGFRKPSQGMGSLAHHIIGEPISHYVGDLSGNPAYANGKDTDRQFAQNLGCKYLDVNDFLA